ncbi:ornithine cyclodeaminase family protein [Pseudomonas daroniae]|uniref:Ornithine cyclodeaminase family protein n=1 Tax=Phytopseudomonas daroniae TaxID=2487519 RepID=A0A4Q9QQR3_9GAMM|nr:MULTISPECIES: ornithine cyclodeaminase family protein [Pseudomonas]TBU83247.1 ornithine cyclodeaminase family protein [Pseudomonas daroniae]TBU84886.1 ornithine cyclodeaminase family protein [Pseudomonas sp. FRB 228]TBU93821.1 ornithine cyclodeaminase family protein [Pseudomonas daroniae]
MKFHDAQTLAKHLDWKSLIDAQRHMYDLPCEVPPRPHYELGAATGEAGTALIMPAWNSRYFGVKTVLVTPGNRARGLSALHSTYILSCRETGEPLAAFDGNVITSRRTAAASALGADFLARKDARNLLLVGAGRVGSLVPQAHRQVREISAVRVWDIDPAQSRRLVTELRDEGFDAEVARSIEAELAWADVVSTATLACAPIVAGAWLKAGTHVDLIGSFTPRMREADDEVMRRGQVFVDTYIALTESGDLVQPLASFMTESAIRGSLQQLCTGSTRGRDNADEITVFKAVGHALADLVTAVAAYQRLC